MRVNLVDFPLNTSFDAADECEECGGKLRVTVTYVDLKADYPIGDVLWGCQRCGATGEDMVGWQLAEKSVKILGKEFYPIISRINVGPCLNCGKLVIGVPLILFLDKGSKGELDFCFSCAGELGILDQLKGG